MKRLDDMTSRELVNLTEEQVKDLIDIECAFAGARLLPPEPVYKQPAIIEPDAILYIVGGIKFKRQDQAMEIVEALEAMDLAQTGYAYEAGYNNEYIKDEPANPPQIESKKVFTRTAFEKHKSQLTANKVEDTAYENQVKLYREIKDERRDVEDRVLKRIRDAREEVEEQQRIVTQFDRYLTLADGARPMAIRFLADALKVDYAEAEEILAKAQAGQQEEPKWEALPGEAEPERAEF